MKRLSIFLLLTLPALLFAGDLWVPATAHAPGAKQTFWQTDLYILNLDDAHCSLSIKYLVSGLDQSQANLVRDPVTITLPPLGQAHIFDLLGTYFNVDSGSGAVLFSGACNFKIASRTYTPAPEGTEGTYGQFIAGYPADDPSANFSLIGAVSSADFRTNLGLVNTSQDASATCTLTFRGADGTVLGTAQVPLSPFVHVQYNNLFTAFSIAPQDNVSVDAACSHATVFGYLSIVDNATGDPVYTGGVK